VQLFRDNNMTEQKTIPQGYRQGLVTSITVLLGFSLSFMRYWGFEAEGEWWIGSVFGLLFIAVSLFIQLYSLFRALDVRDDNESRYKKTVGWFIRGAVVLVVGVMLCMAAFTRG
jgi:hypothetical protein